MNFCPGIKNSINGKAARYDRIINELCHFHKVSLIKTGLMFHKYHLLNQLQVFMRYKKLPKWALILVKWKIIFFISNLMFISCSYSIYILTSSQDQFYDSTLLLFTHGSVCQIFVVTLRQFKLDAASNSCYQSECVLPRYTFFMENVNIKMDTCRHWHQGLQKSRIIFREKYSIFS